MDACYVYSLTFPNGKMYIGLSKHPEKRWRQHEKNSKIGVKTPLCDAIRSFGFESIEKKVLLETTCYLARIHERHCIARLGTRAPFGYNLTEGGDGGNMTPEVRKRISLKRLGTKLSVEHRAKISASSRSKEVMTEAVRAKISAATKGKKRTAETRRKISEIQKGKIRGPRDSMIVVKIVEGLKAYYLIPENRERMRIQATGRKMTAEQNERNRQAKIRHWQDPEYRAKLVAAHTGRKESAKTIALKVDALKRSWAEGPRRESFSKAMTGRKVINNGTEQKLAFVGDGVPDGWTLGILDSQRAAMSAAAKNRKTRSPMQEEILV